MTQNTTQLIEETMQSYYDYVLKIENGCSVIAKAFLKKDIQIGMAGVQSLSEGLTWLLEVESLMQAHSYRIENPIGKVVPLFEKINEALVAEDFQLVGTLMDEELKPLFKNVAEWKFEEVIS